MQLTVNPTWNFNNELVLHIMDGVDPVCLGCVVKSSQGTWTGWVNHPDRIPITYNSDSEDCAKYVVEGMVNKAVDDFKNGVGVENMSNPYLSLGY